MRGRIPKSSYQICASRTDSLSDGVEHTISAGLKSPTGHVGSQSGGAITTSMFAGSPPDGIGQTAAPNSAAISLKSAGSNCGATVSDTPCRRRHMDTSRAATRRLRTLGKTHGSMFECVQPVDGVSTSARFASHVDLFLVRATPIRGVRSARDDARRRRPG
jgi:hypothetical protein